MPEKRTIKKAREDKKEGKAPTTQAGEFVREEIQHVREGKHGVRSPQQAIAIGLSKARRAGIPLPPPPKNRRAKNEHKSTHSPNPRRSRGVLRALKKEPHQTVSHRALAKQTHRGATKRGPKARHQAAEKVARTRARENSS